MLISIALLLIFCCSVAGLGANIAKVEGFNRLKHGSLSKRMATSAVITQVEPVNNFDQTWSLIEDTGNSILQLTKSSAFLRGTMIIIINVIFTS